MDKETLNSICLSSEILHDFFRGIISLENGVNSKSLLLRQIGDFVILNISNEHWFSVQLCALNSVRIFDSLGGLLLPSKLKIEELCSNLLGRKPKHIVKDFQTNHPIQDIDSLVCGEHVLINLLTHSYLIKHASQKCEQSYRVTLLHYCKEHSITPDQCVWYEVYRFLKLSKEPDMRAVVEWYTEKTA